MDGKCNDIAKVDYYSDPILHVQKTIQVNRTKNGNTQGEWEHVLFRERAGKYRDESVKWSQIGRFSPRQRPQYAQVGRSCHPRMSHYRAIRPPWHLGTCPAS